jgi:hypothetical protein
MGKFLLAFCFTLSTLMAMGQTVGHKLRKSSHQLKPPVIDSRESQETCIHTDLSKSLLFKTRLEPLQILMGKKYYDSCQVSITVINKSNRKVVFTAEFLSGFLYGAYDQCNTVRSYTTGTGQDADIKDYDYGDLVVADFNFDGREDFATKVDHGGNGGPFYRFYIRQPTGHFRLSRYLTDNVGHFPSKFDSIHKILTVLTHADAMAEGETTYKLNPQTGRWGRISYRRILCSN